MQKSKFQFKDSKFFRRSRKFYFQLTFAFCLVFLAFNFCLLPFTPAIAGPQSTTYEIKEYGFGSGGTQSNNSTTYSLFGGAGQVNSNSITSTTYGLGSGLTPLITANTPPAPTFTNPSSYYNKLKLVINTASNPTDTKYAIAVSNDNFVSNTRYVQADTTLGVSPVWQTYTTWGGVSGVTIIGLTPNTTYTAKVSAIQGNFTQSAYSATSQVATSTSTLSLSLSPNSVSIGSLIPATVVTAGSTVTVTTTSNGTGGISIYAYDTNAGLLSTNSSYTITSNSVDLTGATEGYGIRGASVTQSSGGPMQIVSPYNGAGNNVGLLSSLKRSLFDSSNQPVTSGQGVFEIKAKAGNTTKAATDYADTITIIASATF